MFPNENATIMVLLTGLVLITAVSTTGTVVNDALAAFTFSMDLEQSDSDFTGEPQYDVTPRVFNTTTNDTLCPTNNCTFELNDGEFRKNTISNAYVLTGELVAKRPSETEGETFSTFHNLRVDLDKMSAIERSGSSTEYLTGSMDLAGKKYSVLGNANFTDDTATELAIAGGDVS